MLTIVNTGFLVLLVQVLNNIFNQVFSSITLFTTLITLAALGSTLLGGLLLLTQTTFKGLLASNSIINTGFILLGFAALLNLNCKDNQLQLIILIVDYLF